ncbi:MAG TPA: ATP-binding protein [Candidatus Saccharimonadales bacterium]|jgi:signal transduction histidine kinase
MYKIHLLPALKFVNKGLLAILSLLVLATLASILFLSYALLNLDSLIRKSGQDVGSALILQDFFIDLEDAESSARGYVITGDDAYLDTYTTALRAIPRSFASMQPHSEQTHNISASQLKTLQSLSNERLAILQQTVETRQRSGEDAARAAMASGEGRRIMDAIRAQVSAISSRSLNSIRPQQQQSEDYLQRALWVAGAVTVLVLGLCVVIVRYFQYAIRRERTLEGTKNEFLSLASHQLRTPATNVKQYIGLLLDGYLGDISSKQRDALNIAYKNNESEIRIMNDLLDVAKLDLKRIHIRKQRVNIVAIVKQVLKDYDQHSSEREQTLTLQAPDELMAAVDRTYFKSVIQKLVDNAMKYSHDKTRISVRIRANPADNTFKVIVHDHGLGIERREMPKLFTKFTRLANEFSANTEGSGLGLYWVKQIMVLHGGTVKVVSQKGRGSKFIVQAPLGNK